MKSKKGFTLIELLAVIVILGLLMSIAIPSVTKYITQSRKKTLTTTIGNYMSALTTQVNDIEYIFTATNTIYALPIECIALERGGTNPFGEWYQASNSYWAYVLVQYDDNTSSYTYGFTFKDSAGYGLYPTTMEKLNESGKQINTDLDLNRPKSGFASNITVLDNWNGFILDNDTELLVLDSTSDGSIGDGSNTCTLSQKGDNYTDIEIEKEKKYKPGYEVCFGDECFYIMKSDSSTVTLISKYGLNPDINNPIQNRSAAGVVFANNAYWSSYSGDYPAYIYDGNSNLYQYIEAYESYLRKNFGLRSDAKLISYEQLVELGCVNYNCSSAPNFVKGSFYWMGTARNNSQMLAMGSNMDYFLVNYTRIIRPVITVPKTAI